MNLDNYLRRIDYHGSRAVNADTLRAIQRAHLLAIPYENLDIHLGRTLPLDLEHIYTKLVEQRRGGWCYEMNGILAWALRELGFEVTMLGSSVGGPAQGMDGDLDHLILLVQLEQPWLVDAGFGNGLLDPLPLSAGDYQQDFLNFRLEQVDDKWFFHNHIYGGPGFGFTLLPRTYAGFAPRCHELQTLPSSGFVRATVCHRYLPDGFVSLRGAMLKQYRADGVVEEEIGSAVHYRQVLQEVFGLEIPEVETLWPVVWARHLAWKAELQKEQAEAANV